MPDKVWKRTEREIARLLNTQRTPLSGISSRHTGSDTLSGKYYIEIKHRKKVPFRKVFDETIEGAKREGKIPMLVTHEKGQRIKDGIVFMRLEDLLRLLNGVEKGSENSMGNADR